MADYIALEDGTGKILLEDGTGGVLLEVQGGAAANDMFTRRVFMPQDITGTGNFGMFMITGG